MKDMQAFQFENCVVPNLLEKQLVFHQPSLVLYNAERKLNKLYEMVHVYYKLSLKNHYLRYHYK